MSPCRMPVVVAPTLAVAPLARGQELKKKWLGGSIGAGSAALGDLDGDGRSEFLINSDQHLERASQGALCLWSGNDLWLNAAPKSPKAGVLESLAMHGAPTGQPVGLFLTAVNGAPTFQLLRGRELPIGNAAATRPRTPDRSPPRPTRASESPVTPRPHSGW